MIHATKSNKRHDKQLTASSPRDQLHFTNAFRDSPIASLLTGSREIPVDLIALILEPHTSPTRQLELMEAMVQIASDRSVLPEYSLIWYVAADALMKHLRSQDDPLYQARQTVLQWKVVEFAARANLPVDTNQAIETALSHGPIPEKILQAMPSWRISQGTVARILLYALAGVDGSHATKARAYFSAILGSYTDSLDASMKAMSNNTSVSTDVNIDATPD